MGLNNNLHRLAIGTALLLGKSAPAVISVANATVVKPLAEEARRPIKKDSFCWVSGVDRTPYGVEVFLSQPREVHVKAPGGTQSTEQVDPKNIRRVTGVEQNGNPTLILEVGSEFLMSNGPSDTCSGKVHRNKDGTLSLAMNATLVVDGKIDSAEGAIYAQPADDVVKEAQSDDFDFYVSWPAAANNIAPLKRRFERDAAAIKSKIKASSAELAKARQSEGLPMLNPLAHHKTSKVAGDNPRILSLLTYNFVHHGGAHGDWGYGGVLWDRKKNAEIKSPIALFKDDMAHLRPSWCAALDDLRVARSEGSYKPEAGKKYGDIWECPGFKDLAVVPMGEPGKPFDRIRISAAPYVAGPFSDGSYDATFPVMDAVLAQIKPAYRAAFQLYNTKK